MILLIDNYDSFTYNLVQAFAAKGADVRVFRNDAIGTDEAIALEPTHLVISPGPGRPEDAGSSLAMIAAFSERIPVLGVCLGHQCLARGMSQPFEAGRYHSLCADPESLPAELKRTAETERGEIMGVCHETLPLNGVQFHPESVLTPEGDMLLGNFMRTTTS